jgi:AcrR family transcriptional regulator
VSDTRENVLHAARQIYLQEGLAGLSMRKVARDAGISATAIYRHFEDKEAMLISVVAQGSHLFMHYLSRGLKGKCSEERLKLSGQGYLDFALEHSGYYRIMFMSSQRDSGLEKLCAQNAEDFAPTFQFLVDRVRECIADGIFRKGDPDSIAATIWANCHGLVSLRLADHLPMLDAEQFRDFYLESTGALLRGLA